jgi:hypothetical protein
LAIKESGLQWDFTLADAEKATNLSRKMIRAFNKLSTPDRVKTLKSKIVELQPKKMEAIDWLLHSKNEMTQRGYQVAIRGEKDTLLKLLDIGNVRLSKYFESNGRIKAHRSAYELSADKINNLRLKLSSLIEGFASAYLQTYLENELEKLTSKSMNSEHHSARSNIQLHWTGQKNQLYHVLRQLKSQGLIMNSYEELAFFIKNNVNIFNQTSLSTITKELGKSKPLPKHKRLPLK